MFDEDFNNLEEVVEKLNSLFWGPPLFEMVERDSGEMLVISTVLNVMLTGQEALNRAKQLTLLEHKVSVELTAVRELLFDCFNQACNIEDTFDHDHISSYENAQEYLIKVGLIKQEQCQFEVNR